MENDNSQVIETREFSLGRYFNMVFALYEALYFFPFYLIITQVFKLSVPVCCGYIGILALAAYGSGLAANKYKLLVGLPVYAALTAAFLFLVVTPSAGWLVIAGIGMVMYLYCLLISTKPGSTVYVNKHLVLPAVVYPLIYMVMSLSYVENYHYLGYAAAVLVCVTLPLYNHYATIANISIRRGASKRTRALNMLYTLMLVILFVIIVNIAVLRDWFITAFQSVIIAILWLMAKLGGTSEETGDGGGDGGSGIPEELMESAKAGRFWEILGEIFTWLVAIAVIVGALLGIYFGGRWLYRFIKKKMQGFLDAYNDGYIDESQTLKTIKQASDEFANNVRDRIRKLLTPPVNWDKLSAKEKVRHVYMVLSRRAEEVGIDPKYLTPRELMRNERLKIEGDRQLFEDSYNEARYSTKDTGDKQVTNARKILRGK